jgi:2,3-bisphosphoglycerate-dependent phosphoglycerate mutase
MFGGSGELVPGGQWKPLWGGFNSQPGNRAIPASLLRIQMPLFITKVKGIFRSKGANIMNYLVLLRHGQSQWNLENRFTGFKDVDLTPEGEIEARNAGKRLYNTPIRFDAVFTSTLKRANKTAKIALENSGQREMINSMTAHDDLRERDYGDLTGLNKDETRKKYGEEQVHIWRRSYDVPPPNGESLMDVVEKRVRPYYAQHIKPLVNKGESVLVAAHGNSLRALLIILGAETPESINNAELPTGVPLVFEMEKGKIKKRYFLNE